MVAETNPYRGTNGMRLHASFTCTDFTLMAPLGIAVNMKHCAARNLGYCFKEEGIHSSDRSL
jgi:hypothetical protein